MLRTIAERPLSSVARQPLADVGTAHGVFEKSAAADQANRLEAGEALGQRTAADFLDARRRLARIFERG